MRKLILTFLLLIIKFQIGESQMAEYFQVTDSFKVESLVANIVEVENDSIVFNLKCHAFYSDHNGLDSILCFNENKKLVTRYVQLFSDSGYVYTTTYYDELDNSKMYRIEKFIYGKESSLEFLNSKNGKGYKLSTIFDDCCTKKEQLWHINDTLTIRQITEVIYDDKYDCSQFCAKANTKTYNPFNSIYLYGPLHFPYVNDYKAVKYKEEYAGKQFMSLRGDTIITTKTDSSRYFSEEKAYSNDTLNYREIKQQTFNEYGANYVMKWYDTKYYTKRDNINYAKGMGSDEGPKQHISITNRFGTFDYEGKENTPIANMTKFESNSKSYKDDGRGNWKSGIFVKSDSNRVTVTRKINYY